MERPRITREEAETFRQRWRSVNAFNDDEMRNTPTEQKLVHLSSLYNLAVALGWLDKLGRDEEQVWMRWQELRRRYDGFVITSQPHN